MGHRAAKAITDVLAPWVIIIAVTVFVSWRASAPWYGLVLIAGASLGPIGWIKWRVRRGSLTDIHVGERDQRGGVFAALICSVAAVTAGFGVVGAPSVMTALAATMLVVLVATGTVTVGAKQKISMHSAVAAGSVVIAAADVAHHRVALAAVAVAGSVVVSVIGEARVVIKDHTRGQVLAGTVVGALCALAVFPPLM